MWYQVAVAVVLVAHFWIKWRLGHWKRNGIVSVKPAHVWGNMRKAGRSHMSEITADCYRRLKARSVTLGGFYHFLQPKLIVLDLTLMRSVLTDDFAHSFSDREMRHSIAGDHRISPNLLTIESYQLWQTLRDKIAPTLAGDTVRQNFDATVMTTEATFEGHIKAAVTTGDRPLNVTDCVSRFYGALIERFVYGHRLADSKFVEMTRKLSKLGWIRILKLWLVTGCFQKASRIFGLSLYDPKIIGYFTDTTMSAIAQRGRRRSGDKKENDDYLNTLLNSGERSRKNSNKNNKEEIGIGNLSFEEINGQLSTFLTHGMSSNCAVLSYCLYEVARNAVIEQRVREEVRETIAKHKGNISVEALQDMTYLEQVLLETLRMHPPLGHLTRQVTHNYTVPDSTHVLLKGTELIIPIYGLHYDPEYYPEPHQFDPERFTAENIRVRKPFTYMPFGEGPRTCPGIQFSMLTIKLFVALLLNGHAISLNERTKQPIKVDPKLPFVTPKTQIWIDLK